MVHSVEAVMHLLFCGCEVATYVVIGDPPLDEGFDQLTCARPRPEFARTDTGADGCETFFAAPFAGADVVKASAIRTQTTIAGRYRILGFITLLCSASMSRLRSSTE
jgi:hypothetical protein